MESPADITGIQMEMISERPWRPGVVRRPLPDPEFPNPGRYEYRKSETVNPISPKVWAGAAGASAGTVLSGFLLWLLGASVFHAGWGADRVDNAIAAVPSPLAIFVWWIVTAGLTMIGGYLKSDPERLPTLGLEQRKRVGLQGVDTRPRRKLEETDNGSDVVR